VIDNIGLFKSLVSLSNELNAIRLQNDHLHQYHKNNALIDEISKELKALLIVQKELKENKEKFIKKNNSIPLQIQKIDFDLELLKNQQNP
jgi:hypothetical protein